MGESPSTFTYQCDKLPHHRGLVGSYCKDSTKIGKAEIQWDKHLRNVEFVEREKGFATVHPNNCGPSIWILVSTYYLLEGNRRNRKISFIRSNIHASQKKLIYAYGQTFLLDVT
jgi:hypothetical protein